jgi:phosphatidylinositol-3-phosphatase
MTARRTPWLVAAAALFIGTALPGCSSSHPAGNAAPTSASSLSGAAVSLPTPDHVVVVIFENKEEKQVQNSSEAPYFNQLATKGATFSDWVAITHPSQPNYLAMFSGSTQGVAGDECLTKKFPGPDLGGELIAAGKTHYSFLRTLEDMYHLPHAGASAQAVPMQGMWTTGS